MSSEELMLSNSDLEDRLRLRAEECDLLRGDLRASTEELVGLQGQLREHREKIGSLTSEIIPLRHAVKTSEKKRELLESQIDSLQKNLLDKKNELNAVIRDHSDKSSDLEIRLRAVTSDLERSKSKQESLQDLADTQNERIEGFIQTISDLEASHLKRTADLEHIIDKKSASSQHFKHNYEDTLMKVDALEQGNAVLKEEALTFKDRMRELEVALEESRGDAENSIGKLSSENSGLLKQIKRLQEEKAELQVVPLSASGGGSSSSRRRSAGVSIVDSIGEEGVLDAHELYEHLTSAQIELAKEKNRRKEAEQYLSRIHKDIELKGPIISKMKGEHSLLLHENDTLTRQMDSVLKENSILRDHVSTLEQGSGGVGEYSAVKAIYDQNKDLSMQVSSLLARGQGASELTPVASSSSSSGDDPMSVISAQLVPFSSIEQLQQRNMQLLQVVRRLASEDSSADPTESVPPLAPLPAAADVSGKRVGAANSALSSTLSDALEELKQMRESRGKAEAILLEVMRERDELKAVITPAMVGSQTRSADSARGNSGASGATPLTSPAGSARKADRDHGTLLERATAPLQAVIGQLENRLAAATQRLEESQKERASAGAEAQSTVFRLREEGSDAKRKLAEAEGKALSLTEQMGRLQEENASLRSDFTASSAALLESERKLEEARSAHLTSEALVKSLSDDVAGTEEAQKFLQLELELAQAAESSAMEQLAASEEERRKEGALLETVRRMERDLAAKREGDTRSVSSERDSFAKELAKARKELLDAEMLSSSRVSNLEEELKKCSVVAEEKIEEAAQLRLSYTKLEAQARAATDRLALLEKQLSVTQERMVALQGAEQIEEVLARQGKDVEKERDEAQRKLEQCQQRLEETQAHMEYFRKIGLATDEKMKAMQTSHAEQAQAQLKALEDGNALVLALRAQIGELTSGRDAFAAQQAAFAEQQREEETAMQARREDIEREARSVQAEVALAKQREESQKVQISHLTQLADTLRTDLDVSKKATASLQAEKEQGQRHAAQLSRSLQLSEESVADLTANAVSLDAQHKEAMSKQEALVAQLKDREQDMRRSSDLLHAQIQTLGARIGRYEVAENPTPQAPSLTTSGGASGGVDKEELDDGGTDAVAETGTHPPDAQEELAESRRSTEELRELVWLLKRERDALETRVSTADRDHARASAALSGMQKSLEEARAQLRRESERRAPTRAEADFQRLISEVSQLNKMQEQLAEVRRENQRLTHINSSQFAELATLRSELSSASGPKDAQIAKLTAAKNALETRVEGLSGEKTLWTQRLQQLFERYKDVDPEEFARLQTQSHELSKRVGEQEQQIAAVTQSKTSVEKASESLRNKMRQLKAQAQEQLQRAKEAHSTEVAELQAKLAEATKQAAAALAPAPAPAPATAQPIFGSAAGAGEEGLGLASGGAASVLPSAAAKSVDEKEKEGHPGLKAVQAQAGAAAAAGDLSEKQKEDEMQRMRSILKRSRNERSASMEKEKEKESGQAQQSSLSSSSSVAPESSTVQSEDSALNRPSKRAKKDAEEELSVPSTEDRDDKDDKDEKSMQMEEGGQDAGAEGAGAATEAAADPATALLPAPEEAGAREGGAPALPTPAQPAAEAQMPVEPFKASVAETDGAKEAKPEAEGKSASTFLNPFVKSASSGDKSNPFAAAGVSAAGTGGIGTSIFGSGSGSTLNAGAAPFTFKPASLGAGAAPVTAPSPGAGTAFTFAPGTSIFGQKPGNNPSPTPNADPERSGKEPAPKASLLSSILGSSSTSQLSSTTSPFFTGFGNPPASTSIATSSIGDQEGLSSLAEDAADLENETGEAKKASDVEESGEIEE
jgi:hypothetical protein